MNETISGRILTPQGWVQGRLHYHGAHIAAIEARSPADDDAPADQLILPGFIDLHVHGAGGIDIMEGGDAAQRVARLHARHGTTTMLGTTMTASPEQIERALVGLGKAIAAPAADAAQILGVHLEGPFLNCQRLGAQPPPERGIGAGGGRQDLDGHLTTQHLVEPSPHH